MSETLTALLIIDHGSRLEAANRLVAELAERLAGLGDFPIVEIAHLELAAPTIAQGFEACVRRGARRVIVLPYFLGPGRHVSDDIPRQVGEAASAHPGVGWNVAEPLGIEAKLVALARDRALQALGMKTVTPG